ncbi:MAG TPA: NAD(P)-dependent oxidoreductase [Candidatus Dormibacteraeota bacterium]|nr:NAD(P)-dependent oxidoreductase [Candidatus Dormibacteraeota bacterium]
MNHTEHESSIIGPDDLILITGAAGFIGWRVVQNLLDRGFRNLRCFARRRNAAGRFEALRRQYPGARVEVLEGNLLSPDDCRLATKDAAVIFHLAAGRGEKLVPDAFLNSVVTTRNLLEACLQQRCVVRRFVNISSFAVYTNARKPRWRMLDESCPVEAHPEVRGDAYTFAKVKQDELVVDYGKKTGIPYVIVRPGYVYGPGAGTAVAGRVGTGAFGLYLHLGGSNPIPLSYIDNCADAIALAGLQPGIDGEVFNVVDDDLVSSRRFLRLYKRHVARFKSVYLPKAVSYLLFYLWERYSASSQGQLPPAYNRSVWHAYWKKTCYSNKKLKARLGWAPKVSTEEGLRRFFEACRVGGANA